MKNKHVEFMLHDYVLNSNVAGFVMFIFHVHPLLL